MKETTLKLMLTADDINTDRALLSLLYPDMLDYYELQPGFYEVKDGVNTLNIRFIHSVTGCKKHWANSKVPEVPVILSVDDLPSWMVKGNVDKIIYVFENDDWMAGYEVNARNLCRMFKEHQSDFKLWFREKTLIHDQLKIHYISVPISYLYWYDNKIILPDSRQKVLTRSF